MLPSQSKLVLLVVALSLTAGCAGSRRNAYLHEKASTHVYRQPVAEVWPKAKELLTEEGYSVMEAKGGFEMQTEWLMQGAPSSLGTSYARYLVRGIEKGPGQCSVEFLRQVRTESKGGFDANSGQGEDMAANTNALARDHEMEWKLLQRVDTESAKALEAEAQQKAQ